MTPSNQQIIRAALSAIVQAQQNPESTDLSTTLDGLRIGLNEFLLRNDEAFFLHYVEEGKKLALEANRLLSEPVPSLETSAKTTLAAAVNGITAHNAAVVNALAAQGGPQAVSLADRIVEWELSLYAKRMEQADGSGPSQQALAPRLTRENLEAYLREHKPDWPNLRVTSFKRQPGGYSKITILADVHDDVNGDHGIVIRAEPARRMLDLDGMAIAAEFPVVRYAFEADLPVAEPILLETDTRHLGLKFMISRRMPGKLMGSFTGSDSALDEEMVKTVLALIAKVANTPVDPDSSLIQASHLKRWIRHASLADNTREFIEYWRDTGVRGHSTPSPLLNRGVNWLLANVPQDNVRPNLIHGDIGFHNILFDGRRVSALLDWENARFGDTAEEMSMFESSISAQFSHDDILKWYHEAGGPHISEYRLRYFDVYMSVKIIVAAQVSLQRVEEDANNSLHLLVFGLRYLHLIGSRLNQLIKLAEDARERELHTTS